MHGISTEACFFLRCFDGLNILATFAWLTITKRSPRAAARYNASARFNRVVSEADVSPSSFAELQENPIFRILLFVATALPQAIKLLAVSGVFWTKLWAFMFVGSFVIIEVIVLQLGRGWQDEEASKENRAANIRETTAVKNIRSILVSTAIFAGSILAHYLYAMPVSASKERPVHHPHGNIFPRSAEDDIVRNHSVYLLYTILLIPAIIIEAIMITRSKSLGLRKLPLAHTTLGPVLGAISALPVLLEPKNAAFTYFFCFLHRCPSYAPIIDDPGHIYSTGMFIFGAI